MTTALAIIQIVVSVILIISILLQSRGSGLGAAFGGEGNVYRTKRGIEKTLFTLTIVFGVIFFGIGLFNILSPVIFK
jgi:preprotein translocase subunit SecG